MIDGLIDKKIIGLILSILLIISAFSILYSLPNEEGNRENSDLNDEDDLEEISGLAVSYNDLINIIKKAGYEPANNTKTILRNEVGVGWCWYINWKEDDNLYSFKVDVDDGEIIEVRLPTSTEKVEDLDDKNIEEIAVQKVNEIEGTNFSSNLLHNNKPIRMNFTTSVEEGWRLKWEQNIDGIPVINGMVVIELSVSGQLGYYYNYWLDLNIDTNDLITDEEAYEAAREKALSNESFPQESIESATSIETELVVDSPNHYFEERDPKIELIEIEGKEIMKVNLTDGKGGYTLLFWVDFIYSSSGERIQIQIDAHSGEYLGMHQPRS